MRAVYVVNERAQHGEPVLIRKPDAGEKAMAAWDNWRLEAWSRAGRASAKERQREVEGAWVPR